MQALIQPLLKLNEYGEIQSRLKSNRGVLQLSGCIESQKAHGVDFDVKNPFKKIGMILPLCFPLLLSSVRKIDSTATAAELRGFYLRTAKSCSKTYKIAFRDVLFTLIGLALLAGAIILNILH